ncbi:hypothetical protein [Rhizobium sp. 42MFCr.1]|uniref:hypothetical protein n=1 Tax=Rhizobium sp. 42MFCr.1 TaxID=1048680 RepID=UPI0003A1C6A9|nr:arginine:ornithine antiporter/lysine permease [Rhizobium sp. 57MFTsu3.2]
MAYQVVQIFLVLTLFAEYAFHLALELTSSMILVPYILVAAYGLHLALTGETYDRDPEGHTGDLLRASIAVLTTATALI